MAKKILVVDDEADIRDTLKTILEKAGYKVTLAIDADDALKKYSKTKPDLVLLDIMMPGTPVKEIIPKLKSTKIAFLSVVRTSEAEKENLLKSKNISAYIQKPFDIEDLLKKIKKLTT